MHQKTEAAMKYNEMSHFSHPHKLKFEYSEFPFKCDGCKEVGIGSRYKCSICDYDLHLHCAIPSPSIFHPFYTKCSFQFLNRPPGDSPRYCNACEKDVTGFVYHCKSCGFDLHPCCAKLPMVLDDGDIKLYLYRKVSSACHRCGRKGRSWSYRSNCKKYNLHVACVREMLVESWHEIYVGRGKGRKLETRIPSLKNTLQTTHNKKSRGKVKKCCEMAGIAVQVVISAVLGDPTALIAGVIGSLMSHS
ncbi:Cysteine/Histidine-rich C1 domain family protein [Quillaja saponaria]|uniref:Cysteine/Histidine-rich C1 domain family protein n=1 Tax=Quillaja saponaria TaxID=32244 RepID=A0AAD7P8I0_QUISA|nr:Cysteine/Histidine-rich C1 domain family protein [Quillaja saponaria]